MKMITTFGLEAPAAGNAPRAARNTAARTDRVCFMALVWVSDFVPLRLTDTFPVSSGLQIAHRGSSGVLGFHGGIIQNLRISKQPLLEFAVIHILHRQL
jgi:hypothetical protein